MKHIQVKPIIEPIPIDVIESELTKDKFVRLTNYGNNEIYIFSSHDAPNLMKEVGRLREIAFRNAGGGTGKEADIDDYDTGDIPYKQLIVWDPKQKEITGGYRYILCDKLPRDENGNIRLATTGLFEFSDPFVRDYLPHVIELGRSFVQPKYQSSAAGRKTLYALDNLWDGLGALVVNNPSKKYFFGKVTMYLTFSTLGRDLILYFMQMYFPDNENLVYPKDPCNLHHDEDVLRSYFHGNDYDKDYRILSKQVRKLKETIPPLINSYMNLSSTARIFGTALNYKFGEVEETGLMITISDIYEKKKERHIMTYKP